MTDEPTLTIGQVAQRAGMILDEIAPLTGPDNRTADEALITRARA